MAMSEYYCPTCSLHRNLRPGFERTKFVETAYQVDKFNQHTQVNSHKPLNGVLFDPSTVAYHDMFISVQNSGSVEVDDMGRTNILIALEQPIGDMQEHGVPQGKTNVFKAVLTDVSTAVHGFPNVSSHYVGKRCVECGGDFLPGI